MNLERRKGSNWALDDSRVSFDQVEDIDGAMGVVRNWAVEPVPPRLDKFECMQAGALLGPTWSRAKRLEAVDEILFQSVGALDPSRYWRSRGRGAAGAGSLPDPCAAQSQSLKVKMYGVALISSTIELRPSSGQCPRE